MSTQETAARRPTRDEALDNSAKVAARIWWNLTDDERAAIIAEQDAINAERAGAA